MKKHLITSLLMVVWTTVLLGLFYPLVVTAIAQVLFKDKANGQLITRDGAIIGSRIIGQPFAGPGYFHSRPSAAGNAGYDAANSQGSNFGPTNQKLIDRVQGHLARLNTENPGAPVPDPARCPRARLVPGKSSPHGSGSHQASPICSSGRASGECAGVESGAGW